MKDIANVKFLKSHLFRETTHHNKGIQTQIKHSIFGLIYLLLKNQDINLWIEIITILFQLLQLLAFPFITEVTIIYIYIYIYILHT